MTTYGSNFITVMTSNTAPSGWIASATFDSSGGNKAFGAFDGSIAQDDAHMWYGYNNANAGILTLQMPVAKTAAKYRYYTYYQVGYAPKSWTFQGSNDGSAWTTLDTQSSVAANAINTWYEYTFANTTAYLYYRMNITATQNSIRSPLLVELEMFEVLAPLPSSLRLGVSQAVNRSGTY